MKREQLIPSDEVRGKYMEVIITHDDGDEHVYWVNLTSMPDDGNEWDWSIGVAVKHHNNLGIEKVTAENATSGVPFSRYESEVTFL
jgi:hypothetical protein